MLISSILSQGNGRKQTEPETPLRVSGRDRSLAPVTVPQKPQWHTLHRPLPEVTDTQQPHGELNPCQEPAPCGPQPETPHCLPGGWTRCSCASWPFVLSALDTLGLTPEGATDQASERSPGSGVLLSCPGHGVGLERTTRGACLGLGLPGPSGGGRQIRGLVFWNKVQSCVRVGSKALRGLPWPSPAQCFWATTIRHCPPRQQNPELSQDPAIWPETAGSRLYLSPGTATHPPSPPGCQVP